MEHKVLALAGKLASDHDGEILSSVKMLQRLAGKAGKKIPELIAEAAGMPQRQRQQQTRTRSSGQQTRPRSTQDWLRFCLKFPEMLSEWERGFARDVSQRFLLTSKQQACADRIILKVRRHKGV